MYSSIFQDAKRALLLSGTPALSRPIELFTQIKMLDRNFRTINAIQFGLRYCDGVKVNCCYITVMVFSYMVTAGLMVAILVVAWLIGCGYGVVFTWWLCVYGVCVFSGLVCGCGVVLHGCCVVACLLHGYVVVTMVKSLFCGCSMVVTRLLCCSIVLLGCTWLVRGCCTVCTFRCLLIGSIKFSYISKKGPKTLN